MFSLHLFTLMVAMFGRPFSFRGHRQTGIDSSDHKPLLKVAGMHKHNPKQKYMRFMCLQSDLNAQIAPFCLLLDANSQSEIIMTESKLPLHLLTYSSGQATNIHSQTHPHMYATLEAGRWRNSVA